MATTGKRSNQGKGTTSKASSKSNPKTKEKSTWNSKDRKAFEKALREARSLIYF